MVEVVRIQMLGMVLKQDNDIGFLEEGEGTGF